MRPYPDYTDESECSPQKHFKKNFSSYGIADVEESKIHFSNDPAWINNLEPQATTSESDHSNSTPARSQNDFLVAETPNPGNKSKQSNYKNKSKELFQKAVKVVNDIKEWNEDYYQRVTWENEKSDGQWAREGELLKQMSKNDLLFELRVKQYCQFAELYNFKEEMLQYQSDVIKNFSGKYKDTVSKSFFEEQEFSSSELFEWMLLMLIILTIIPEDPEYLGIFPLKKSTVFLGTWLEYSSMKLENKILYSEANIRGHLRKVMTKNYHNLMTQALEEMDQNALELLHRICDSLGVNFANY